MVTTGRSRPGQESHARPRHRASGYIGSRLIPGLLDADHDGSPPGATLTPLASSHGRPPWSGSRRRSDERSVLDASRCRRRRLPGALHGGRRLRQRDLRAAERWRSPARSTALPHRLPVQAGATRSTCRTTCGPGSRAETRLPGQLGAGHGAAAAMILGAASTSFELVRRMRERVPVVPVPAGCAATCSASRSRTWCSSRPAHSARARSCSSTTVPTRCKLSREPRPRRRPARRPSSSCLARTGCQRDRALEAEIPRAHWSGLESLTHDVVCREDAVRRDRCSATGSPGCARPPRVAASRPRRPPRPATVQGEASADDLDPAQRVRGGRAGSLGVACWSTWSRSSTAPRSRSPASPRPSGSTSRAAQLATFTMLQLLVYAGDADPRRACWSTASAPAACC